MAHMLECLALLACCRLRRKLLCLWLGQAYLGLLVALICCNFHLSCYMYLSLLDTVCAVSSARNLLAMPRLCMADWLISHLQASASFCNGLPCETGMHTVLQFQCLPQCQATVLAHGLLVAPQAEAHACL